MTEARVSVRLPVELFAEITELAAINHRTFSEEVRYRLFESCELLLGEDRYAQMKRLGLRR